MYFFYIFFVIISLSVKLRCRAVAHIVAKGEVTEKRRSVSLVRPRETGRPQPMRVHKATTEKKAQGKQQPYETRTPRLGHERGKMHPLDTTFGWN